MFGVLADVMVFQLEDNNIVSIDYYEDMPLDIAEKRCGYLA